jgi:hypothetical protein
MTQKQADKTLDEFAEDMGINRSSLSCQRSEFRDDPQQGLKSQ